MYLERLNLDNLYHKQIVEVYRKEMEHLRKELEERTEISQKSLCAIKVFGKILEDDRKIPKETKVYFCINNTPFPEVNLAAPFLIYFLRKEIEKILCNKLRLKGKPFTSDLSKNKQRILREWMTKPAGIEKMREKVGFLW